MNPTKCSLIVFSLVLLCSSVRATVVQPCLKGQPSPYFVNITNCEREPCIFVDGTTVTMDMAFIVPKFSNTIKPKASATLSNGITVPYPLPANGCDSILNGYCPLYENEVLLYQFKMPMNNFPPTTFTLEFQLLGDNSDAFTCFRAVCSLISSSNFIVKN